MGPPEEPSGRAPFLAFPPEIRKIIYFIRSPQRNRTNVTGRTAGWKAALNTPAMFYGDRITLN